MLGSKIEFTLSSLGLTSDRVERWLGRPCGCRERREQLNALSAWAVRVLSGKVEKAKEHLEAILQ